MAAYTAIAVYGNRSILWSAWILLNIHSFRKNFITKDCTVQFFFPPIGFFENDFPSILKYFSSCDSFVRLPTRALRVDYNLLQAIWRISQTVLFACKIDFCGPRYFVKSLRYTAINLKFCQFFGKIGTKFARFGANLVNFEGKVPHLLGKLQKL